MTVVGGREANTSIKQIGAGSRKAVGMFEEIATDMQQIVRAQRL